MKPGSAGSRNLHHRVTRALRLALLVVMLCLVLGVVIALVVKVPGWERAINALPEMKDRIAAQNAVLQTMLQFVGGTVVLTGLYFTSRTLYVSQQGQITGRFNDAIEHLGGTSLAVRLGGIYALARIAADSARDAATIVEIFSAFLRDATATSPAPEASSTAADVRAVLMLLGTAEWARVATIDLRGCRFAGLMTNALDLRGALLDDTVFYECRMPGSVFDGASLVATDFGEAYLRDCSFRGCDAMVTNFAGATLRHADFSEANVFGAKFNQASLIGASFDGAKNGIRQQFEDVILDETTKLPIFEAV
jgi:uncharacterized protein YjbI with pentapeptide repeats